MGKKTIGGSITDKMLSKTPGKDKQKQANLSVKPGAKLKKRMSWDANLPSAKMRKNPKR
jgi:hypothetical protein